ncbi:dTMP kinase [Deltaproteobacteria bacterium OttesenSCG-928-K17]|nr:dTMP kinase [Deltaproteobacteria bacterium OttesenSCG-928-K17]
MTDKTNFKKEINLRAPGLNRGFFIVIEGLDGAGKSTQVKLLAEALKRAGYDPAELKEPTDGPFGQKIRAMAREGRRGLGPEEELALFIQDRAEDVAENIAPALLAGRPVICDRYILSNVAYQSALGLDEKFILKQNERFPWPDLTVILETPVETGLGRIAANRAGGADAAYEAPDFQARVKKSFDRQNFPGLLRLDGRLAPEQITALIMAELKRLNFMPKPAPRIIDSHCHLCSKAFKDDLNQVLDRAEMVGVTDIINIGLGPENSRQVLALADKRPWCRPVIGWHPHEADELTPEGLADIISLAGDPRVLAFGEIGLDYALMHSEKSTQLKVFEELLEAAVSLNLPVVIHSREAFDDTYRLLKKFAPRLKSVLIHCFTRGWEEAEAYLELGFYLSIPGVISYPKNEEMRAAAAKIPDDRLMIETDAPYLTPVPFRGRRNEPSYLIYHLMALAELRGKPLEELAALTSANAKNFFNF